MTISLLSKNRKTKNKQNILYSVLQNSFPVKFWNLCCVNWFNLKWIFKVKLEWNIYASELVSTSPTVQLTKRLLLHNAGIRKVGNFFGRGDVLTCKMIQ